MANYYGTCRTNYFRVNDEEKLKDIVNRIMTCDGEVVHLFTEESSSGETLYGFGTYSSICGLRKSADYVEDDDYDYDENNNEDTVYEALQEVVADDDVIVIEEVGAEKLRYLSAWAILITADDICFVNLKDGICSKAKEMLRTNDFRLADEY